MIHDWLTGSGSVFVRIERPHSGASGDSHVVRSLQDLRTLLARETHPEIEIFIFQEQPYPDDDLLRALERDWVYRNTDRVLYFGVQKNRNHYGPYEQHSTHYESSIRQWAAAG
jgi:hypothetical protein